MESVGGCLGPLFSRVCALGFGSEVVNATVAVDQGCPMKMRRQGILKRRPGSASAKAAGEESEPVAREPPLASPSSFLSQGVGSGDSGQICVWDEGLFWRG